MTIPIQIPSIINIKCQLESLQFGLSFYVVRYNSNRTWLVLLLRKQCVDISVKLVQRMLTDQASRGKG